MKFFQNLAVGLAVLCAQVACAYDWPASGTATIPANTAAAITDADVANVTKLSAIVLSDATSSVTAEGLASSLTLMANVSGPGTLTFNSCTAGLILAGDNSALTGNFSFSNTVVTVASRYGLGGSSSGMAVFTQGASGAFNFSGEGLTNDAPIKIDGAGATIPSNETDEPMVQNNDLHFDVKTHGGAIKFRNFHMISGTFKQLNTASASYFYGNEVGGGRARFGAGATVSVGLWYMSGSGVFQFDAQPAKMGLCQFSSGGVTIAVGADEVFPETRTWDSQLTANDQGLDLMGHTQTLTSIGWAWRPTVTSTTTGRYAIKSSTPGTLRIIGKPLPMPYKFMGAASFDYNGTGEFQLINATSDTTGGMTVSSGTLTMMWNYGWEGTNVLVKSGATLNVDTSKAITTGKARLVVESGATLNNYGNALAVASANIGGVELEHDNIYTAAWITEHCPGATWSGEGTLTVLPEVQEEFEWPTEPGAIAHIPIGRTISVTDADIAKLANLGGIELRQSSTVSFEGLTSSWDLKVPLTGYGTISVSNCTRFAITSSSPEFTGLFKLYDSGIVVSNIYALGNAKAVTTQFTKGTAGTICFMGSGLTNDVPINIVDTTLTLPGSSETGVMQQGGSIFMNSKGIKLRNFRMTNGTFSVGSSYCAIQVLKDCTATFDAPVVMSAGLVCIAGEKDSVWDFYTHNFSAFNHHYHGYSGGNWIRFEDENILPLTWTHKPQINGTLGGFDLNGYDQTIASIPGAWYTAAEGNKIRFNIKSASPATLKLTGGTSATTEWTIDLPFLGQASFEWAASNKTINLVNQTCDTTGDLTVSAGTLTMKWNYGWEGSNVLVKSGATLNVNTPNAITTGRARLVVETDGTFNTYDHNITVSGANLGGVELANDAYYTADQIASLCPGITWGGSGVLLVVPEEQGEFEWPTEPGAIAVIPMAKTVVVTDEDLPKLAKLGGIQVKGLGVVSFEGLTSAWDLKVPITGFGTIRVTDCERYVITSDNREFLGHFEFIDSGIVVSNRYALGSVNSQTTEFTKGTDGTFSFMGPGLTNEVALLMLDNCGNIPYGTDETLYQYNSITLCASGFNPRNLTMVKGVLKQNDLDVVFYLSPALGCKLTIEKDAGLRVGNCHFMGGYTAGLPYSAYDVYNSTNIVANIYTFYNYCCGIICGIKDVFKGRGVTYSTSNSDLGFNMNGYDQSLTSLASDPWHYTPARGAKNVVSVLSDEPATMTMSPASQVGPVTVNPIRFRGQSSFTYAPRSSDCQYKIINHVSDTEGTLTVTNGTLTFMWDSGWNGKNVVVTGGTLVIDETARTDFFSGTTAGISSTTLSLSGDGVLSVGAGISTRVAHLLVDGVDVLHGVYGGPEAGLDEAHTLDCLSGTGLISVQVGRPAGLQILFR